MLVVTQGVHVTGEVVMEERSIVADFVKRI